MGIGRRNRAVSLACAIVLASALTAASASGASSVSGAPACGPGWQMVPSPNPPGHDHLFGVAAISPRDAWAVGWRESRVLTMRWDGAAWGIVNARNPSGSANSLAAVDASGPDDVWAVGSHVADGFTHLLAEHWDGAAWTLIPTPPEGRHTQNRLDGVKAFAPDDVWAVGRSDPVGGGSPAGPWLLHWGGASWTRADLPFSGGWLTSVDGVAPDDVWAVGSRGTSPLALHWDGRSWTRVRTGPASEPWHLTSVRAISSADVWVLGEDIDSSTRPTEAQHWDGSSWTRSPRRGAKGTVTALAAVGHDDIWAVGTYFRPEILAGTATTSRRWDGTSWQRIPTPAPGDYSTLLGADALPTGQVWAVGDWIPPNRPAQTLILLRCSG